MKTIKTGKHTAVVTESTVLLNRRMPRQSASDKRYQRYLKRAYKTLPQRRGVHF